MIDSLISILQQSKNRRIGAFFSGLGYVLVLFLSFLLGWNWLHDINRSELMIWGRTMFGLCFLILIGIILGVLKSWKQKEVRFSYLYTVFLPLLLICEICVGEFLLGSSVFTAALYNESAIGWFLGGMNGQRFPLLALLLCSVFPVLQLIRIMKSLPGVSLSPFLNIFARYNIGYFFILTLCVIAQVTLQSNVQNWVKGFEHFSFFMRIFVMIISVFIFTFPFIGLREQYKISGLKFTHLVWGLLSVIFVFIVTNLIPSWLYNYGDSLIENATRIIANEGMNRDAFEKARGLGLEQAYERYFNKVGYVTENTIFTKLFDATPEEYFKNKLKNIDSDGSMRGGTNETQIGKNAQVLLKLAEISNVVIQTGSESPILKTVVSFHVNNLSDENQEFIVYFSAPSTHSVISELKLGLHGEMQGVIAPRGAAKKVYEEAIRTRKDPALLEKVGASSYSLRVYPVLGKRDEKTLGKQLVQFTILTPIIHNQTLSTPLFSFINLKLDETTSLLYKKYELGGLVENMKFTQKETESILAKGQPVSLDGTGASFCIPKTFLRQLMNVDNNNPSNVNDSSVAYEKVNVRDLLVATGNSVDTNTLAVFLDNSLSAERNKVNTLYPSIIKALSEGSGVLRDLDLYSYNFVVEKIADASALTYRGYTDNEAILDYIEKEGFQNQTIVIVTDDENFSLSDNENKNRNIASLRSNRIIVLAIGDKSKRYNLDMMNIISASHGDMKMIQDIGNISGMISTILSDEFTIPYCDITTEPSLEAEKIIAGAVSNKLLGLVSNEEDRLQIANLQESLAKKYGIVNQFNAMIALETEQQKEDLDRYSQGTTKFDKDLREIQPEFPLDDAIVSEGDMPIDFFEDSSANREVRQDIQQNPSVVRDEYEGRPSDGMNSFSKSAGGIGVANDGYYPTRELYFSQSIVLALCIIYITLVYQIICTFYILCKRVNGTLDVIGLKSEK